MDLYVFADCIDGEIVVRRGSGGRWTAEIESLSIALDGASCSAFGEGDTPEVKAWNDGVTERSAVARAYFMDQFDTPEEKADAASESSGQVALFLGGS